jgi:hypothetical protein
MCCGVLRSDSAEAAAEIALQELRRCAAAAKSSSDHSAMQVILCGGRGASLFLAAPQAPEQLYRSIERGSPVVEQRRGGTSQ